MGYLPEVTRLLEYLPLIPIIYYTLQIWFFHVLKWCREGMEEGTKDNIHDCLLFILILIYLT